MLNRSKIIIASNRPFIGRSLKLFIEANNLGQPLEIIRSGQTLLERVLSERPSVIILDLFMPQMSGVNILTHLKKINKSLPILCYCNSLNRRCGVIAIKAGARGVFDLGMKPERILEAIKEVQRGHSFIPTDVQILLDRSDYEIFPENYRKLTPRQAETLELIGRGFSHDQISWELKVSRQMVSKFKKQIANKLGLLSSQEIALYAIKNGLVETGAQAKWAARIGTFEVL